MSPVQYARSGGLHIAYRTFGDGPVHLVLIPGFISHIEHAWQEPGLARYLERLGGFCRVIAFDKRGMGLSDRDPRRDTPTLSERMDDITAVMGAAGAPRAALFAWSEGGPTAITFAHTRPEQCIALVLAGTTPTFVASASFPEGIPRHVLEIFVDTLEAHWGTGVALELYAPSLADNPAARDWWAAYQRLACTPGAVAASLRLHLDIDVKDLLSELSVPTLVLHQTGDMVIPVECARYLQSQIPHARLLEGHGNNHMYWLDDPTSSLAAVRELLTSTPEGAPIVGMRRAQRSARAGWESLTRAELDVIRLMATGSTNPEVATRLGISPRTVQTHVTHVLRKLGLNHRGQVIAEAVRRGL